MFWRGAEVHDDRDAMTREKGKGVEVGKGGKGKATKLGAERAGWSREGDLA